MLVRLGYHKIEGQITRKTQTLLLRDVVTV